LETIGDDLINNLIEIAFDLNQLSNTLNNDLKKPNSERNFVKEDTYSAIYHVNIVNYYYSYYEFIVVLIYYTGTEKFYVSWVHGFT
jgi:hypothetical protein